MSYNYTGYVNQLTNLMVVASSDANFQTFLPGCIDYAEQRLYRELDLVGTSVVDSGACVVNNRLFNLPTNFGNFLVVDDMNVITPVTAGTSNGTRNPLYPVTTNFINACYPNNTSGTGVPRFMAILNSSQMMIGPVPDQAYTVEVLGTQRPTPLSSSNTTTILTTMLPDLFMAASMVFATGYQRDFGSQSDDPQRAVSWQAQYDKLFASANVEELRKQYQSQAWTAQQPNPVATPPRA